MKLVKEKNNFFPVFARGALCTSFILSAVYNDCVSSSERASIAIGVFELPNAVETISKGTKAVADPDLILVRD